MPRLIVTSFFLTAIVLFEATGQDHPSSGQSREAFLSQLIQKLDTAKVTGDTVAIVRSLASLAINLQNAKMHNRSHAYLQ
ncbi:MAG: hypothetical protein HRT61_21915, partial [Ekhidna sp.]|nr:hypothetical protein [Ekhidna sp.]